MPPLITRTAPTLRACPPLCHGACQHLCENRACRRRCYQFSATEVAVVPYRLRYTAFPILWYQCSACCMLPPLSIPSCAFLQINNSQLVLHIQRPRFIQATGLNGYLRDKDAMPWSASPIGRGRKHYFAGSSFVARLVAAVTCPYSGNTYRVHKHKKGTMSHRKSNDSTSNN